MILSILILVVVVVTVVWALPQMPRWVRVGFWVLLTILHISNDDSLLAAISAAIAVQEGHKP